MTACGYRVTFLDAGFKPGGAVRLPGTTICGQLLMSGARLESDSDGVSLLADGLQCGNVFLDHFERGGTKEPFETTGSVQLVSAQIRGKLDCAGAQLGKQRTGYSVRLTNARVVGNVYFNRGFSALGQVHRNRSRIEGQLAIAEAHLRGHPKALAAVALHVEETFVWAPQEPVTGEVDLRDASVQRLEDKVSTSAEDYWPAGDLLRIDGLTYDAIAL